MQLGRFSLFLLVGASLIKATTVTNVTCATFGASAVTTSSSCYAAGPSGYSKASSAGTVTLPNLTTDSLVVTADSDISGLQGSIRGIGAVSVANASTDVQVNLNTNGPARQGMLEVTVNQLAWQTPYSGSVSEHLTIGGYTYTLGNASLSTFWIPVTLGTAFGFDLIESVNLQASAFSGLSSACIDSAVSILAFEQNGLTAVPLFDPPSVLTTPEPATAALLAMAAMLAGGLLLPRRRWAGATR